jgi:hypothetical protein
MVPLLNRGGMMKGFVQGADRQQTTLLPECLDDWVGESNPVRAVDVFVDALELRDLGFDEVDPAATGRPAYHPSPMLKLYIYGYLNRVQSSLSLRPWRLALVTQLLALQAPPETKSASVCTVDGRFSVNTDSSPITNNVASAQAVRLTAPPRTSSRKAFRTRGRSTMSVVHLSVEILKSVFRKRRVDRRVLVYFDRRQSGRRTGR